MTTRDTLTTAYAIPDQHRQAEYAWTPWLASIVVLAPAGIVRKAAQALGLRNVRVEAGAVPDTFGSWTRSSRIYVPLGETAEQEVAQAAAEGIARAIGHVIPKLKEA